MRDRGSAVLIENNKVVLIKRIKDDVTYYVFPGGGIEKGETPEEATIREAYEELGIDVGIKHCMAEVDFKGKQFFFLGDIVGGTFDTGKGEEFSDASKGMYIPMWVDIESLSFMNVKPKVAADKIISLFK
ncbi:NUDIX domain-containing protein [Halobacillus fulvus]|nr:NUDIX domain-containing protein [Halobacillus fulvus]